MDDQRENNPDPKTLPERNLNNYRPIMCLSIMWKILTAQMRQDIYYLLISHEVFPEK